VALTSPHMMCRQEQGDPWIEVATGTLDRLFRFWDKKPSRRGTLGKPRTTSPTQMTNPLLSRGMGFELETSIMGILSFLYEYTQAPQLLEPQSS
ncbi:MAG: hypothetical protein Q8763_02835, partial [Candidatus Phytoplasma australasiaticum]|nr:hypothetical protein [Candidatus Phytoplasma australasiaticum]